MNLEPIPSPTPTDERVWRKLGSVLARRARGTTLLLHREGSAILALPELGIFTPLSWVALSRQPSPVSDSGRRPVDGVCIVDLLEYLEPEEGRLALEAAWTLLRLGGRLVVVVPNGDFHPDADRRVRFDRKGLVRRMRAWGEPRLLAEQPFRWLAVEVRKPRPDAPLLSRVVRDRVQATAHLCRGRVIELGCGEGHLTQAIRDRGLEVVGVDLSERKIQAARARHPGIPFRACDILELDEPDGGFDTVVLAEVLEHLDAEPGGEILARAWRLLRPHGRLVVSVPNEDLVPHRNHRRTFDHKSLKKLLRSWGRTRVATEQPFKWLLMTVEKAG